MTRTRLLWIGFAVCLAAAPAEAAELALKRVMLSSGGVGYFEYQATVEGDAVLTLDVALDQVDDILKSLVVYDATGTAGEVTLPGRNPLTQSFADLPFDRPALGSAEDLLNALQGAEIRVTRPEPLTGRLVHADRETVPGPGSPPLNQTRVTLLTASGLQQFLLQDATAISFVDPELQDKVAAALQRIAAYHDEARRRLLLNVHGNGRRAIRIGYVVAMPLWKASYRLSLPADPTAATARLQGWAVLENMSGAAWRDVELTLLSGNPVTFRQALYESYYVTRPTVPVESGGRMLPPPDTGAVGTAARMQSAVSPPPAAPAPSAAAGSMQKSAPLAAAAPAPAGIEAVATAEDTTQIAFTLPYKISAPAGQSLMLPLLDRELPARRMDFYQQSVDRQHPLAAIEMTNNGDSSLPPGVLTLYQQGPDGAVSYIGDARLAAFPAGDKRMLSYAADQKVAIDSGAREQRPIVKATIAGGVMHLRRLVRRSTSYHIKALALPARLLIEHPRHPGWTLTEPDPHRVEFAAGGWRIPAEFGGKNETVVTVVEEQPVQETVALTDLADERLDALASSSELDPSIRQAMTDLAQRRQAISRQRSELDKLREQRDRLVEDESRLRDNLGAIGNEPGLRKRLLDKFNQIETAIDNASSAIAQSGAALASAERDLAAYIEGVRL